MGSDEPENQTGEERERDGKTEHVEVEGNFGNALEQIESPHREQDARSAQAEESRKAAQRNEE